MISNGVGWGADPDSSLDDVGDSNGWAGARSGHCVETKFCRRSVSWDQGRSELHCPKIRLSGRSEGPRQRRLDGMGMQVRVETPATSREEWRVMVEGRAKSPRQLSGPPHHHIRCPYSVRLPFRARCASSTSSRRRRTVRPDRIHGRRR